MPYIYTKFAGKKTSGGFIKIDGGRQIKLLDDMLVYVPTGSHCIDFSSISTFNRGLNHYNLYDGNKVGRAMALHEEMKAVDGQINECFETNSVLTLEIISDDTGHVLSLPKYWIRQFDSDEFEEINELYHNQQEQMAKDVGEVGVVDLLLCLFLGIFGVHKFYRGKIGMGILYIFTCGLFGIGVIVDLVKIIMQMGKK